MEENKIIDWVKKRRFYLFILLTCLLALGIFIDRSLTKKKRSISQEYLTVRQLFDNFFKGENISEESLTHLETVLKKHPELHPKYDLLLECAMMQQQKWKESAAIADSVLQRVARNTSSPNYEAFARCSILILKENYPEALEHAQSLEQRIKNDPSFDRLRAFNLLRISFLAKEMGDSKSVQQAYEILTTLPSFSEISAVFQEGLCSLNDYIKTL